MSVDGGPIVTKAYKFVAAKLNDVLTNWQVAFTLPSWGPRAILEITWHTGHLQTAEISPVWVETSIQTGGSFRSTSA